MLESVCKNILEEYEGTIEGNPDPPKLYAKVSNYLNIAPTQHSEKIFKRILISYASEDRAKEKDIYEALEEQGWSVWWDRHIPPGKSFDEVISKALNAARCVIVLWFKASTQSNWVKDEASEGARRNILMPVLIEDVTKYGVAF